MCAKKATGAPIDIAWQKLKEAGYEMEKDRIHNYLYVSATFSTRSIDLSSSGVPSIIDYLNRDSDDPPMECTDTGMQFKLLLRCYSPV